MEGGKAAQEVCKKQKKKRGSIPIMGGNLLGVVDISLAYTNISMIARVCLKEKVERPGKIPILFILYLS